MTTIYKARHWHSIWILIGLLAFTALSCKTTSSSDEDTSSNITVSGQVTDKNTGAPIANAIVRITSPEALQETKTTDQQGNYQFSFKVDSTFSVQIEARKEGYDIVSNEILVIPGRDVDMPKLKLISSDSGDNTQPSQPSGGASSIELENLSRETLVVQSTGGAENAEFTFQVRDSAGVPLDENNASTVSFSITSGPDGGEAISPSSATTDAQGQVKANLQSGTKSGVVKVLALIKRDTLTIKSTPITVAIHSGFPDQDHFSVASEQLNIAGYNHNGITDVVTAYVGDKYGNNVQAGTNVYFTTDGGQIDGSAQTDEKGRATVELMSNDPRPEHPDLGRGYATITAQTVNDNDQQIKASTVVLFSGDPVISGVSPASYPVSNIGSQTYSYSVTDENNNPLAAGNSIKVESQNDNIEVKGDVDVTLEDSQQAGSGTTDFSFTLSQTGQETVNSPITIKITNSGPNGSASKTVTLEPTTSTIKSVPSSITLDQISSDQIGVKETGQTEEAQLTFQIKDQSGNPLDINSSTEVQFALGSHPDGGESVYPTTVQTDGQGQATTTLTSGTKAGVVQVIAEVTTDNGTIRSQPVSIAIHAGLPDQDHFSLAIPADLRNVAASNFGAKVPITAYVGDKYGNTVPEGTTIYFTTEGGYITGSAPTNAEGEAQVNLTVAKPIPSGGIGTITASTANDNQATITASADIMFSGAPTITVNPTQFDMANAGDVTFNYTVEDADGNPMQSGTNIDVTVEGDEVEPIGDVAITVGNVNGGFSNTDQLTNYTFNIRDAAGDTLAPSPVQITITVDGPNGSARTTISGTKAKALPAMKQ